MTHERRKPITIVGGGIAGLTLGILLRREGIPVTLLEAGTYPRHKVCGEFISGRGIQILGELGIHPRLMSKGAREAKTIQFFSLNTRSPRLDLPEKALCISRHRLDHTMSEAFCESGGELKANERGSVERGTAGLVVASGRRLSRTKEPSLFWGLKIHARQLELGADLEMHFASHAYIGLNRIEDGRVNLCGLFRTRKPLETSKHNWLPSLVDRLHRQHRGRIESAEFDLTSLSFVSGLGYDDTKDRVPDRLSVGDAACLIPPVTGNGISKALESATLAVAPLVDYSKGDRDWAEAIRLVRLQHQRRFARRLLWARFTQRLLLADWTEALRPRLVRVAGVFYRELYAVTR